MLPPIFPVFDFPRPTRGVVKRDVTTVPPQSFFVMNNPLVQEIAAALAGLELA